MAQDGSTFHKLQNQILPYYPKKPVIFPYQIQPTLATAHSLYSSGPLPPKEHNESHSIISFLP